MLRFNHTSSRRSLFIIEHEAGFEVTRARIAPEGKLIHVVSSAFVSDTRRFFHPVRMGETIAVALGSAHATTIESSFSLTRDNSSTVITESEMDHLVFKGLWEFLHQHRAWAAKKMKISDLSLVLASIEVKDVMLGSHHVFNPIGFKGGVITLRLRGTFVARELLPSLERIRSWGALTVIEEGIALADAIPKDECLLACVNRKTTSVFSKGHEAFRHIKEILWGTEIFAKALGESLGVDYETAESILAYVGVHGASPSVARHCRSVVKRQYDALHDLVDSEVMKRKAGVRRAELFFYFKDMAIPEFFSNVMKGRYVRIDEYMERGEYSIETKKGIAFDPRMSQTTLALFLSAGNVPKFNFLNQMLMRRARWLIPHFSLQ